MATKFTRQPNGNYRFEDPTSGRTFEARKTNTGVSWELYEITFAPVADNTYHEMVARVDGVHETRHAAAEYATILAYNEALALAAVPDDLQEQEPLVAVALPATKTCAVCKQTLPSGSFGLRNRAKDHLQAKCKTCRGQYRHDRRVLRKALATKPVCESGWTGDRCTLPLGHEGAHSN